MEGKAGFKNLYTRLEITDLEFDENLDTETLDGDFAFSYGGRAGLWFRFGRSDNPIVLDISASYLRGTAASFYIRDESIPLDVDDPLASYEQKNSTTDLLVFRLGIAGVF